MIRVKKVHEIPTLARLKSRKGHLPLENIQSRALLESSMVL